MTGRIDILRGDITAQHVDAIVNAANSSLYGGGGVDGAIHQAAGIELIEHCRSLRRTTWPQGLPTGQATASPGGALAAQWVIHTVGPKYWEYPDGGAELLAACHRNAMQVVADIGARSVAFPAISCGIYGWKPAEAAPIALGAVREMLTMLPNVTLVQFVLFNDNTFEAFQRAARELIDV
jgi:O-acetyl-ADP-ribose deacetylase (regulator of RNase III)